jgi:hypothetical protein
MSKKLEILITMSAPEGTGTRELLAELRSSARVFSRDATVVRKPLTQHEVVASTLQESYDELREANKTLQAQLDTANLHLAKAKEKSTESYAPGYEELKQAHAKLADDHSLLREAYARDTAKVSNAPYTNTVQVINAIIASINSIDHTPPQMKWSKTEYYKKGGRDTLRRINEAVRQAGFILLEHGPSPLDGELFNYWVQEASTRPARVAKALSECTNPQEYRAALVALHDQDKRDILSGARINPEGGLVS